MPYVLNQKEDVEFIIPYLHLKAVHKSELFNFPYCMIKYLKNIHTVQ